MIQKTAYQMLKEISYNKIRTFPEPITKQPLGQVSKRDLIRIVYVLNGELFKLKNDIETLKKASS